MSYWRRPIWVSLILLFLSVSLSYGAKGPVEPRVVDQRVNGSLHYSFSGSGISARQAVGSATPSSSPGWPIGTTWEDEQQRGSMGRMVTTQYYADQNETYAHFAWTYRPSVGADPQIAYTNYNLRWGDLLPEPVILQPAGQVGLGPSVDAYYDSRAIVGAQVSPDLTFYQDFAPGWGFFFVADVLPFALRTYAAQAVGQELAWPKLSYVEDVTGKYLHVVAQVAESSVPDAPRALYYFRRVGDPDEPGGATWDSPPFVVDSMLGTAFDVQGHDYNKVTIAWIANVPCGGDPEESCNSGLVEEPYFNNDVYYINSWDHGLHWDVRVNLTNTWAFTEADEPYFKPYGSISVLLDDAADLHIAWNAAKWDNGGEVHYNSRIYHWGQGVPYIRMVHDADWEPGNCLPGAGHLNTTQTSISQCNGRFYVLFTQFNDRPNGVLDDCASTGNPRYPVGAANGDLYVCVSGDGGLTWDAARNLTNTYTPGCDSVGGTGGPCDNDHSASMPVFGDNHPAPAGPTIVVPAGGTNVGGWLDVQYINDHSAGTVTQGEGTWQMAHVRWFRMACVYPVVAPRPIWEPPEIGFPAWTKATTIYNKTVTITNIGNTDYNYSVTAVEDAGTLSGWLSYTGFDGLVPSGPNNEETGEVVITPVGANFGEIHRLTGRLTFSGNAEPFVFEIDFIVADTVIPPIWDTIATACTPLALQVRSDGLFGAHDDSEGGVGLDFYPTDCDTTAWPYVYSGSPIIMSINGTDTLGNWSIFENDYTTPVGFYPVGHTPTYYEGEIGEVFRSTFLTRDSSIVIEKTWFAPEDVVDHCEFVVQQLKIYSNWGVPQPGLVIGEVVDWDIPSDSGVRNGSGFNWSMKLFWQFGGEYNQDDTTECQESDARLGGLKFLGMAYVDGAGIIDNLSSSAPYTAYTADNPTYVYGNDYGFQKSQLWENMTADGWSRYTSPHPDSLYTDLHMGMAFTDGTYELPATGALYIWTAYISIENGTESDLAAAADQAQWWADHHVMEGVNCCELRGDFNNDGTVKVSDLTALITYLFRSGPPPDCKEHGDCNGDGDIKVSDLTLLIAYLFRGGPAPPPCP